MPAPSFDYLVPAAELAFIANLADRDVQRLIDDEIVAEPLVHRVPGERRWARLTAAFAKFYFEEDQLYTVWARRQAIKLICERITGHPSSQQFCALVIVDGLDWSVKLHGQVISFVEYVAAARDRLDRIDAARDLIVEDQRVMGGVPTFKGTRIPVSVVSGLASAGKTWSDLRDDYPALTQEMFDAALTYQAIHPRRGRPPATTSGWIAKSSKVVKPANRAA